MAKGNQKAKEKAFDIDAGFDEMISLFDHIKDKSTMTMPLLAGVMRLAIQVTKMYKEAYNVGKDK